ncbi:MAG: glycosyltransferase [Mollicutes bacterium]|nr:glycosyltransferase [Mollicutes bacterium]
MISVIIPVFNVEKYIVNCLKSFENQVCKDFEIILINDGSKDKSSILIDKYAKDSNMRIKRIYQANAGVSAARNNGIRHSSGKYICFVDSDDMITPDYLSDMLEMSELNDLDVSICRCREISEECSINTLHSDDERHEILTSMEALSKFLLRDLAPGVFVFAKKDIIIKNNIMFSEGYRYSEDIEFIYKLLANSKKIGYLRKQLYLYRTRESSAMSYVNESRYDGYKLMENLEEFFCNTKPAFARKYKRFGLSRWVWSTVWQSVLACNRYSEFRSSTKIYNPKKNMMKLITFPKIKVRTTAIIYVLSPYLYYKILKLYFRLTIYRKLVN